MHIYIGKLVVNYHTVLVHRPDLALLATLFKRISLFVVAITRKYIYHKYFGGFSDV